VSKYLYLPPVGAGFTLPSDLGSVGLTSVTSPTPLHEFFEVIESAASMCNWSDGDRFRIASLKLTDTARLFLNSTPELRATDVTWASFKTALEDSFKDPRSAQFHYSQLNNAK
jgi:hypothetical protein